MVSWGDRSDEVASDVSKKNDSPENGCHLKQQSEKYGIQEMQKGEDVAPVTPEKSLQDSDSPAGVGITQLDKEGSISSVTPSKVSQTPGTNSSVLPFGSKSPVVREKMSDDGYHWRKYGQKLVKGNEYVRSYYKCTHPNCRAKKQLERSHDGQSINIVTFGEHDHPKPEHNVPLAVGFVLSVVEEKAGQPKSTSKQEVNSPHQTKLKSDFEIKIVASIEDVKGVLQESTRIKDKADNDDDVPSKRQKKENQVTEPTPPNKPNGESRLVVQTLSQVDIVNDGYRWRKYGQKMVKGNSNPRSYYRCSSPGCPVKKHVERASHDSKVVITSYEGQHNHDMPPSRMVTHNANSSHSGESGAKSGGSDGTTHPSGSSKELLSASKDDLKGSNVTAMEIVTQSGSGEANKSNEKQNGKSNAAEENDTTGTGRATDTNGSSTSVARPNEKLGDQSKANYSACSVRTINPSSESNPNEQRIPNAEPVQS